MSVQKHLVLVAIYELPDQNRDEGVGNVQTLKKLHRIDGAYTFISKYSYRHHLFNALKNLGWKEACVTVNKEGNKEVVQFDLSQDDILTSPELDAFGYMYTIKGESSITRKAAVGLTDIISLEPFNGDSAFYANHDMVKRARECGYEADPNPFTKEEHYSYFKGGMTINLNKLGIDEWIIDINKVKWYDGKWKIEEKEEEQTENKEELEKKEEVEKEDKKEKKKTKKKQEPIDFSKVSKLEISLKKGAEKEIKDLTFGGAFKDFEEVDKRCSKLLVKKVIGKHGKRLNDIKVYEVKNADSKLKGYLIIGKLKGNEKKYKIIFVVSEEELRKRVKDLVKTYLSGFEFQVSGRAYSLIPQFCAIAITNSPTQVFFPNIGITPVEDKLNYIEVTGLVASIANPLIEGVYLFWNPEKVQLNTLFNYESLKDKVKKGWEKVEIPFLTDDEIEKIVEQLMPNEKSENKETPKEESKSKEAN